MEIYGNIRKCLSVRVRACACVSVRVRACVYTYTKGCERSSARRSLRSAARARRYVNNNYLTGTVPPALLNMPLLTLPNFM